MSDYIIDAMQFANWSEDIFRQMQIGKVNAVHATVAYHGNFREAVVGLTEWHKRFETYPQYIFHGQTADDIQQAKKTGRTAIFLGFQNPSPIEDDIGLLQVWRDLGLRFMQLSYNNQSLLACGYMENEDTGITNMGKEVIREMNRLGILIDMSHSGTRSTLEAIELSAKPIVITHANPEFWHAIPRNKTKDVLCSLAAAGGMIGLSLYPLHLRDGERCTIAGFCRMILELIELIGEDHIGIGSDLCQNRQDTDLIWMRNGRWTLRKAQGVKFPPACPWFNDNTCFQNLFDELLRLGLSDETAKKILGNNWFHFLDNALKEI